MRKFVLVWGITWRMLAWGAISGATLGCAYGLLVLIIADVPSNYVLAGPFVGSLVGGMLGLVLGLLDGLALSAITQFALHRSANLTDYRTLIGRVNLLLTGSGALVGFAGFSTFIGMTGIWWLVYMVITTAIAMIMAWIASIRVANWVDRTIAKYWPRLQAEDLGTV